MELIEYPQPPGRLIFKNQWIAFREDVFEDGRSYCVVERADAVIIVPVSEQNRTILLHQWRHPAQANSWELPMGGIDEGETPEAAAQRELKEETGLTASKINLLGSYWPVPGLTPQRAFVCVATIKDADLQDWRARVGVDDIKDGIVLNWNDALAWLQAGKIQDGFTRAGLEWVRSLPKGQ